jgi:carbonic anhydrase
MKLHSKIAQEHMTPKHALEILQRGNDRFIHNIKSNRDLLHQVNETSTGQFPFATILSCIDSRTSAELIFDQGLGDLLSIRIAGNILNEDIIGSMEFATHVAGTKIIVVLGHTNCGAIIEACNHLSIGHFTHLLNKLRPSIEKETQTHTLRNGSNPDFVNNVVTNNIHLTVESIRQRSKILTDLEGENKIQIIGALYQLETGVVTFFE